MNNLRDMLLQLVDDKLVTQTAYDLLAKTTLTGLKEKAEKVHRHQATDITDDSTHRFVTDVEKGQWNAKVDQSVFEDAMRQLASGMTWKGTYLNLDAVQLALPNPESGWVVVTTEGKNTIYIYEKELSTLKSGAGEWQPLGDILFGEASGSQSGLMSAADKKKLDAINPSTSLVQEGERDTWTTGASNATDALRIAKENQSNKADKTTQIKTGNGLSGGGDLTTTRTLTVVADGDSIIVGSGGIKVDVVDDLVTNSTTKALASSQGTALKAEIDLKANASATVTAGNGLQGGGAISSNPTLTVKAEDDSISVGSGGIKVNVVDNLLSSSATQSLSANQGQVLSGMIEAKADKTTRVIAGDGLQGGGALSDGSVTIKVASANNAITVQADTITLNTANDLNTNDANRPLSAGKGKWLNENKLGTEYLTQTNDLNTTSNKGIVISKAGQNAAHRPTTSLTTDSLDVVTLAESSTWFSQLAISQNDGSMYARGSNGSIGSAQWKPVVMGTKSNETDSSSTDTVATSKAVKDSLDAAKAALSEALANKLSEEEAQAIIEKYTK